MMRKFLTVILLIISYIDIFPNVYTVINTNDSGAGSLRQAMTEANSGYMGNHTITFNIPQTDPGYDAQTGTFTIALQSELPYLLVVGNITIDATTQANTNPYGPEIVLDGGTDRKSVV